MSDPNHEQDEIIGLALAEMVADAPTAEPFDVLPWEQVMSERRPSHRWGVVAALAALVVVVGLAAVAVDNGDGGGRTDTPPATSQQERPERDQLEPVEEEEPEVSAVRIPDDPFLPTWVPEGFELTSVRWFDEPEEITPPEPAEVDAVILGNSEVMSDTAVRLTARRFTSATDLERARWIEDALMVQGGGPSTGISVGSSVFAWQSFETPDGSVDGGQFHGTIDDVLITGFVTGGLDPSSLARLLSTLTVGSGDLHVGIDGAAVELLLLYQGQPARSPEDQYWLEFSNGSELFSAVFSPGSSEATIAAGTSSRESDRIDGETGTGFVEAQPEVGGAIGSRRLFWWVPTTTIQVWFGAVLDDEDAVRFADSTRSVSPEEWETFVGDARAEIQSIGPLGLPDDPQQTFADRLAERERIETERANPVIDVADIAAFVGDLRGGSLPSAAGVSWLGPLEADRLTAGADFVPEPVWHVLRAFGLVDPGEDREEWSEVRRQDVRGMCCTANTVSLVEGMGSDQAAVVTAHELTHLYDFSVLGAGLVDDREVIATSGALFEGNATRVMRAYRDARQVDLDLETRSYDRLDIPVAVQRLLRFAYLDGETFTAALAASGGEAAVDRAMLSDPPASTEHILHPDHYLAGDQPRTIEAPEGPEDALIVARSTLGAFVVALAAEEALGWTEAVELSGAWAGDSYVAWSEGDSRCLAARVEFDDRSSAEDFVDAVGGTADGTVVELTQCG